MGLIVVSTVGCDFGPVFICAFHGTKHLLETQNPAKQFRTESHFVQETALQLPSADSQIIGQLIDREMPSSPDDLRYSIPQRRALLFSCTHLPCQLRFNQADLLFQFALFTDPPGKFPIQRGRDICERHNLIRQLAGRRRKERECASGSDPDAQQSYRAGGRDQDWSCHLSNDKTRWLQIRTAFFFVLPKKSTEI